MLTKIDLLHMPFRGAGPASIDVIAGNTKAIMATTSSAVGARPQRQAARRSPSARRKRVAALPDVPTFIEAGLPEYEAGNWIGFAVPAGTPKAIVDKLHKEIAGDPGHARGADSRCQNRGVEVERMGPDQFRAYIEKEIEKWGRVVKEANIKAE